MLRGVRRERKIFTDSNMGTLVLPLSIAKVTKADSNVRLKCIGYEMNFSINL